MLYQTRLQEMKVDLNQKCTGCGDLLKTVSSKNKAKQDYSNRWYCEIDCMLDHHLYSRARRTFNHK